MKGRLGVIDLGPDPEDHQFVIPHPIARPVRKRQWLVVSQVRQGGRLETVQNENILYVLVARYDRFDVRPVHLTVLLQVLLEHALQSSERDVESIFQ